MQWRSRRKTAERKRALEGRGCSGERAPASAARNCQSARAAAIAPERASLERRAEEEDARWEKQKAKLQAALRRARD